MPNVRPSSAARPIIAPTSAWARLRGLLGRAGDASGGRSDPGDAAHRPLPQVSDYLLQHVIARNERATVYRASELSTGRTVALKTVRIGRAPGTDPGLWRERFLREAAAAARLKHPDIVRVHAGGVQGAEAAVTGWLAMEWVDGTDLDRYATPARLLPESLVLGIGARVALALDFAHRAGVVHRDVKPSNVLFDPAGGVVKVTDFGSARVADTTATRSGLLLGTPAYLAPELLDGAEATPQADLYALGLLLFELLVGRRPFEGGSMGDLLGRIAHQAAPRVSALRPGLPPLLDDVVARLLAKKPGQRQPDGRAVAIELRLAQRQCAAPAPGSTAAGWADTQPADDPSNDGAGSAAFQCTIDR